MEAVNTVLLIDDHALFRKGIAQLIGTNLAFRVVGEASSGREGVAMALELKPDLILVDFNMPEMNGVETIALLRQHRVDARFVVLTVSDRESDILASLRAGAHGYLLKDMEPETLCLNLKRVLNGTAVLDDAAGNLARDLPGGQAAAAGQ